MSRTCDFQYELIIINSIQKNRINNWTLQDFVFVT